MTNNPAKLAGKDFDRASRQWADLLCFWRPCGKAACLRARTCRGHVRRCFAQGFLLLPEDVRDWFFELGEAQKREEPFEAAMLRLDHEGLCGALDAWFKAVDLSLRGPRALKWRQRDLHAPDPGPLHIYPGD